MRECDSLHAFIDAVNDAMGTSGSIRNIHNIPDGFRAAVAIDATELFLFFHRGTKLKWTGQMREPRTTPATDNTKGIRQGAKWTLVIADVLDAWVKFNE